MLLTRLYAESVEECHDALRPERAILMKVMTVKRDSSCTFFWYHAPFSNFTDRDAGPALGLAVGVINLDLTTTVQRPPGSTGARVPGRIWRGGPQRRGWVDRASCACLP